MKRGLWIIAIMLTMIEAAWADPPVQQQYAIVYFQTNVFLHDDATNPLHQRISVLSNANIHAKVLLADLLTPTYISPSTTDYGIRWEGDAGIHNKFGADGRIFYASPYNSATWFMMNTTTQHYWGVGLGGIVSNSLTFTKDGLGMTSPFRIVGTNTGIGLLESEASINLTTGMTLTATTVVGYTNEIKANRKGAHLSISAANGSYPTVPGGHLLLTPGSDGPNNSRVKVTRGIFEADEIKTVKMGLAQVDMPGSEVLSAWLQSDGTNLFFVSTVSPGFTNALTTNSP